MDHAFFSMHKKKRGTYKSILHPWNFSVAILQANSFSTLQSPKSNFIIMQVVAVLLAVATIASAGVVSPVVYSAPTVISRAPAFDSAVIKSDRVGGNFAYSVAENHAYAHHTPIVQHVTRAVGVSVAHGAPVVTGYSAPAFATYGAAPIAYSSSPIGYGGIVRAW